MISKGVHISILISYWMGTRETAADQFNGIAWPTNNFFAPYLPTSVEFLKMMAKLVSQERTIIVGNEMLSLHFPICKKYTSTLQFAWLLRKWHVIQESRFQRERERVRRRCMGFPLIQSNLQPTDHQHQTKLLQWFQNVNNRCTFFIKSQHS